MQTSILRRNVLLAGILSIPSDYPQVINVAATVENYAAFNDDRRLSIIKIITPLIKRRVEITSAWVG